MRPYSVDVEYIKKSSGDYYTASLSDEIAVFETESEAVKFLESYGIIVTWKQILEYEFRNMKIYALGYFDAESDYQSLNKYVIVETKD